MRDKIICPYCQHIHDNESSLSIAHWDKDESDCECCGKIFSFSKKVEVYFETFKKENKNESAK